MSSKKIVSSEGRDAKVVSYTMSRIRSKDTSIEVKLRKALWAAGLRYRKNFKGATGRPDIAFTKYKLAIFCDSTFWHGLDWDKRKKRMQRNREYWVKKIEGNIARDKRVNKELAKEGWTILRFSDTEIEKQLEECVEKVKQTVASLN